MMNHVLHDQHQESCSLRPMSDSLRVNPRSGSPMKCEQLIYLGTLSLSRVRRRSSAHYDRPRVSSPDHFVWPAERGRLLGPNITFSMDYRFLRNGVRQTGMYLLKWARSRTGIAGEGPGLPSERPGRSTTLENGSTSWLAAWKPSIVSEAYLALLWQDRRAGVGW
jgi:hypothetical protein